MKDFFAWIAANWAYIVSALAGVVFVSSIIVKLTPTTKDDSFLRKLISFLDHFSIFKTADDKALIDKAKKNVGE